MLGLSTLLSNSGQSYKSNNEDFMDWFLLSCLFRRCFPSVRPEAPLPRAFISHTSPQSQPFLMKFIKTIFVQDLSRLMGNNQSVRSSVIMLIYMYFWRSFDNNGGKRAGKIIGVIKKQKRNILKIILPWKGLSQLYSRVQHIWRLRVIGSWYNFVILLCGNSSSVLCLFIAGRK